ncbi:methyl jasmonate esterase 1-like isoform X3 [Cucumis melo]|uniref:Methyl jasmonate esterase 1-like isoform X3 n=1 Tax=Cucumis melo TaxID=3656 RepID=A0ABM3KF44_CUCME|nr:methyl jasmonate esterase 1-like isoform X3 [Cucumis melo]
MKNSSVLLTHLDSLLLVLLILLASPVAGHPTKKKTQFVLVHGSFHGAWSWYKLSTILQSWGHNVTALDMAASGIDPIQPKTVSSAFQYFHPLTEFLAGLPSDERVVLVGHSFGGIGVAAAMEDFPEKISVGVFVTATMPGPNLTLSDILVENGKQAPPPLDSHYVYDDGEDKPPTSIIVGSLTLAKHLYSLSPPEVKCCVKCCGKMCYNNPRFVICVHFILILYNHQMMDIIISFNNLIDIS